MPSQRIDFTLTMVPVDDLGSPRLIQDRLGAINRAVETLRRELVKLAGQGMGITHWGPVTAQDFHDGRDEL